MAKKPRTKKASSGAIHRVPCPHCGKANDCRGLRPKEGVGGWGGYGLEAGTKIDCDHCGKLMEIAGVQDVTVITVKQA
jgi:phage FluMu protein Com